MLTMNTTIAPPEPTYPRLMVDKHGKLVLFVQPRRGTQLGNIVQGNDRTPTNNSGYYSESWMMDDFQTWHGSVTLTQD